VELFGEVAAKPVAERCGEAAEEACPLVQDEK